MERYFELSKTILVHNLENSDQILMKLSEQVYYYISIPFCRSIFMFGAVKEPEFTFSVLAPRLPQRYAKDYLVVQYQRGWWFASNIKNGTKIINLGQNGSHFYIHDTWISKWTAWQAQIDSSFMEFVYFTLDSICNIPNLLFGAI